MERACSIKKCLGLESLGKTGGHTADLVVRLPLIGLRQVRGTFVAFLNYEIHHLCERCLGYSIGL